MLPAISPAVISHLAMPNSGVRRYAAALQSLVSAGVRDRLARAEEPVVRRLCAGGESQERTRLQIRSIPGRFWTVISWFLALKIAKNRNLGSRSSGGGPLLTHCENEHFSNVSRGQPMNLPSIKRAGDPAMPYVRPKTLSPSTTYRS